MMKTVGSNKNAICREVARRVEQRLLWLSAREMSIDLEPRAIKIAGVFLDHAERGFSRVSIQLDNPLASVTAGPRDGAFDSIVHHRDQCEVRIDRPLAVQNGADGGDGIF